MTDNNQQRFSDLQAQLQKQLKVAHETISPPLNPEQVASIVRQVIESLEGDVSPADLRFYSELEGLARYIREAKHEIASIQPTDISTSYIPKATDELDAVVGATEDATNKIMDVCDQISAIAEKVGAPSKDELIACTTRIFEACNFQDITGQRITKVVETLKHIDTKIEALVRAMGEEINRGGGDEHKPKHLHAAEPEKGLLNGPQLPGNAVSQDEIDRLLSGA
jgi:chemotaxis protein CheZ